MKDMICWDGVITGVVTAFDESGNVEWQSVERHVDRLSNSGVSGLLVNAMMAEGGHLSIEERRRVLRFVVERVAGKVPVIATVYGTDTSEAAQLAKDYEALGARGLLVFPHPAFGGEPLDPEIPAAYFSAIWNAAELPMIVFRTPASLAPNLEIDALKRLMDVRGVSAIKDSIADPSFYKGQGRMFLEADSPISVLIDSDPSIFDFLKLGVRGATSISAAVNPERYVELHRKRNLSEAGALASKLKLFADAIYKPPFRDFRSRLKAALVADKIFDNAYVRLPLFEISESERSEVVAALAASRSPIS